MKETRNIQTARELVEFVQTQTASRGWGRGLRTAVSEWYMRQPLTRLAVEVLPDLLLLLLPLRLGHAFADADIGADLFFRTADRLVGVRGLSGLDDAGRKQVRTAIDAQFRLLRQRPVTGVTPLLKDGANLLLVIDRISRAGHGGKEKQ